MNSVGARAVLSYLGDGKVTKREKVKGEDKDEIWMNRPTGNRVSIYHARRIRKR